MYEIDLNCDMGESFGAYKIGNDKQMLQHITSANIACGFHAGDPSIMRETVRMAIEENVEIGAHPGLPDLIGFGRRAIEISPQEAYDMVVYQIGALQAFVQAEGARLQHVKPHGALFNMAAKRKDLANAIAKAIYDIDSNLILFGLAGSELVKAGQEAGLSSANEVFADRTYQKDGSLTSRSEPDALIPNRQLAAQQVVQMVKDKKVRTIQKVEIPIEAQTVCLHGDGEHAVEFAAYLTQTCEKSNIHLSPIKNIL